MLRPDLGEEGIGEQVERLRGILEQQGASEIRIQDWGLRDMAYQIENHRRGRYMLAEYEGTAAAVLELERNLKLSDQVLRYMSVRQTAGSQQVVAELGIGAGGGGGEAPQAETASAAEGES